MNIFTELIKKHEEHIRSAGEHCDTEETTKQALILPFLDILGFSPFDPTKVKAEYGANFPGAKNGERVDYALFCGETPVIFIEAKSYKENLSNHSPQLARYFNASPEVTIAAITNGREWRFFTDLKDKNVMDTTPFMTLNFEATDPSLLSRLFHFRHDQFEPHTLRNLAEETVYLNTFTQIISHNLREPEADFVRFVVSRSGIHRQFTTRFLENITPIVKQAVERSVSNMVVSGLSAKPATNIEALPPTLPLIADSLKSIVDPENPKIITTPTEHRIFEIIQNILGNSAKISAKDTETYYAVLFQGKAQRWLIRYYGDKRTPRINVCMPLSAEHKREIQRAGMEMGTGNSIILPTPDHLFRLSGIIFDAFEYARTDTHYTKSRNLNL